MKSSTENKILHDFTYMTSSKYELKSKTKIQEKEEDEDREEERIMDQDAIPYAPFPRHECVYYASQTY